MAEIDPMIPKLLSMKQQSQERRLAELKAQMQELKIKLSEIDAEFAKIDSFEGGLGRLSVENGYLRYLNHRRDSITARIESLKKCRSPCSSGTEKIFFFQDVLRE